MRHTICLSLVCLLLVVYASAAEPGRAAKDDDELRYWLTNMAQHRYSVEEMSQAAALDAEQVQAALAKFKIAADQQPLKAKSGEVLVLPYPGGRHPRIGFLDGAVDPQRETKVSVFTPWDPESYVVIDVPEALWSNLGLTYLAHTHIPTIFDKQAVKLEPLEWQREDDGRLSLTRKLPNGIAYSASVAQEKGAVKMTLSLTNGTREKLSDLRVQNCVMLKGAKGFAAQTNENKVFRSPYVAVRGEGTDRWIITAWDRCQRAWGNAPCPCLHSDPQFPDLAPGESHELTGWLWFYEGKDLAAELKRLPQMKAKD